MILPLILINFDGIKGYGTICDAIGKYLGCMLPPPHCCLSTISISNFWVTPATHPKNKSITFLHVLHGCVKPCKCNFFLHLQK
jgi:hypothetical protein